jgi:NAD(P)-dependent dehydrogenase (short-subunit alcohol dehydrogenase family)
MSKRDLVGRVVAVTGAARGIGLATAQACKAAGMRAAIGDLDGDLAGDVAAEHRFELGRRLDITDRDVFADFLNGVEEQIGPLYALVNNAGVFTAGHYEEEPDDVTQRLISANVGGVATGSKLALQRLLPRRDGHIVNVSSIAAVMPTGGTATYCATKSAVLGLTRPYTQSCGERASARLRSCPASLIPR